MMSRWISLVPPTIVPTTRRKIIAEWKRLASVSLQEADG